MAAPHTMLRRLALLSLLCLAACGSDDITPGETYFWKVTGSTVAFGACADEPDFRDSTQPLPYTEGTYLAYRISEDGKTAVAQQCTRLEASACTDGDSGIVFDIAGRELTWVDESQQPIGSTACVLSQHTTWTLVDGVSTMTLEVANLLSLTGDEADCARVEADMKRRSPNGLGVEGCVVTFTLEGERW